MDPCLSGSLGSLDRKDWLVNVSRAVRSVVPIGSSQTTRFGFEILSLGR